MAVPINETITWAGKIDWELRTFHGEELSTHRGSSYNSYLVRDEKTVLIDTVWTPHAEEWLAQLKKEIDLTKIDYIIANHGERDHSGALPLLMEQIPDTPIYCTSNAVKSLKGQYHQDWNFVTVKTGDRLNIGKKEFIFIEANMLHWPDSMMSYLTGDGVLFSNDAFGQHLASESLFADRVNRDELFQEAIKYYANILTPFSALVDKKIKEILALNLPLNMILPSHGVIWRDNPAQIVEQYAAWADAYQEAQVTIVYDTMWDGTRKMAEAIADGIRLGNPALTVKLYNISRSDKNDVMTEVFKSKAILVGSPTINRGILSAVAAFLEESGGLRFKNKKAAAFGAFGWSGESVKLISARLQENGFELVNDGLRIPWSPDEAQRGTCVDFGREFAAAL
ncbi:MAG: anaerobic nitric oxide reductase flavorubredoxin [Solirubrobacterales bacterium]